jgi:hypothetical protein
MVKRSITDVSAGKDCSHGSGLSLHKQGQVLSRAISVSLMILLILE